LVKGRKKSLLSKRGQKKVPKGGKAVGGRGGEFKEGGGEEPAALEYKKKNGAGGRVKNQLPWKEKVHLGEDGEWWEHGKNWIYNSLCPAFCAWAEKEDNSPLLPGNILRTDNQQKNVAGKREENGRIFGRQSVRGGISVPTGKAKGGHPLLEQRTRRKKTLNA